MTDQGTETKHGDAWYEGIDESEMDQQRFGDGLGDSVDGKDVADLGRRRAEPPGVGSRHEPLGAQPEPGRRADAGDVEDLGPDEGGPDEIESQDATGSSHSGL